MCRDVTVERLLEKKIIYSANTDQLTDLYNRRYFYEYMTRNKIMSKHVNLFYIDLDNLKRSTNEYDIRPEIRFGNGSQAAEADLRS